ncbi:MAG TPA: hypothetical protein VFE96_02120, partial [Candidatus Bathyarchaeia archaeon]|nr:hypothetical protein [Candidatus Bathyarchaeia archaeon]
MMVPRKLLTHGAMIRLEEEEDGGAGVILMEIDSYYDRKGKMESVRDRIPITFFFPNYGPSGWKPGQPAWVHFELYADWDDVTKISSKEKWIKPFGNARTRYRYSLAGEMFQLDEPGHDEDLYVNPGFPISMTLGMPPYPKKPGPVV